MLEQAGVSVFLNELSCTVVFERPREERFVRKWQAGISFAPLPMHTDLSHARLPQRLQGCLKHVTVALQMLQVLQACAARLSLKRFSLLLFFGTAICWTLCWT